MKTEERKLARELRATKGLSVKEIARRVGVSQASVSLWVRDIQLTPAQHQAMMISAYRRQLAGREKAVSNRRNERLAYQEHGRELARGGDESYIAGCMLYWAEGDKTRNSVRLANADPQLLVTFASFLRRHFAVPDEAFRIYCNLFADHLDRQRAIERFWLERLDLSETCLRKSVINVYSKYSAKKRTNRLPHGTCKLVVHSTRIVQTIYGSIQEYGGFERPEWLD